MTTHVAALQAKADQATADRERAERALARVMRKLDRTYDPGLFPVAEAIRFRRWETLMEMPSPPAAFAQAHAAFCRAKRAETKAKSAAHRASWADAPRTAPVIRQDEGLDAAEVYRRLRELRAERVAA